MLTPTKQAIENHIETLSSIWDSLASTEEIISREATQIILADALEGKLVGGLHGKIQQELLLLHTARQQIEQVITTLLIYRTLG